MEQFIETSAELHSIKSKKRCLYSCIELESLSAMTTFILQYGLNSEAPLSMSVAFSSVLCQHNLTCFNNGDVRALGRPIHD